MAMREEADQRNWWLKDDMAKKEVSGSVNPVEN